MLWLLLLPALIWGVGFLWVRRILRERNLLLAVGLPLPIGLLTLVGLCQLLGTCMPHRTAWVVGLAVLAAAGLALWIWTDPAPRLQPPGLRPIHGFLLACGWAGAYFSMHTRGLIGPEDDYWVHFPMIALIERGLFPPVSPFLADLVLQGHFGRDYLLAVFSWAAGGDVMAATWVFNHTLQIAAYCLASGLGLRWGRSPAAGVLLPWILFFGISTGSRVGLMDTYDNNNLLVYAVLLALLTLLADALEHQEIRRYLWVGALIGFYAGVYETHMALSCACLVASPFVQAWCARVRPQAATLRSVALALLVAVAVAVSQRGPIQDLALRFVGVQEVSKVDYQDAYETQRVTLKVPKQQLFQIKLGRDAYRRLSYVYEGKLFAESLLPQDEGGYAYVWSPKVLLMHWMALYLGFPAVLWLARERCSPGLLFWLFGLAAYLTPALVDFGPVHENEYFRWEFAAGFGFAGALALALAGLWERARGRRLARFGLLLVCLLTLLGGERKLNRDLITVQKAPADLAPWLVNPLYPDSDAWFLKADELKMTAADLELCRWLRARLGPQDRLLTNILAREHWDTFQESTLIGLAGARSVAHQSPPPWVPDGISPYFRTANWIVFWQKLDPRALAATRATWLYVQGDAALLESLKSLPGLVLQHAVPARDGTQRAAFKIVAPPPGSPAPAGVRVGRVELPDPEKLQSEVAYPVEIVLENATEERIAWSGPLGLRLIPEESKAVEAAPLCLWVDLDVPPAGSQNLAFWLVPPLVEGRYHLEWYLASPEHPLPSPPAGVAYSFTDRAGRLRIAAEEPLQRDGLTVRGALHLTASAPFGIRGPLTLGWRIWDAQEGRYLTPYGFDGQLPLELRLDEGQIQRVPFAATLPEPAERYRLDFFLRSLSGLECKLER